MLEAIAKPSAGKKQKSLQDLNIELEMKKVQERLTRKHLLLTLDQSAKDFLVLKGYEPEFGARPIRRAIERYIEEPLSEWILRNPNKQGMLLCSVKGEEGLIPRARDAQRRESTACCPRRS